MLHVIHSSELARNVKFYMEANDTATANISTQGEKMNARKLLVSVLMFVIVLLSACTPAATPPAPTAVPPTVAPTVAPTQATNSQIVEYDLPTSGSEPGGIVVGPDGALWFVETAVNKIGRISTDGVVTEYPVPTAGAIDTDQGFLAVGPDGALWFNEDLVNQIGRI